MIYYVRGHTVDKIRLSVRDIIAGLTPLESLRTAAVNPAKYPGMEKEFGTIEKGKLAHLILLEANPLENINHTRRIDAVVFNGRYLPKETLGRLLAEARTAASDPPFES